MNFVYQNEFTQIVKSPTRVTDKSQTLIDHIIKNITLWNTSHPKVSDHCILTMHLEQLKEDDSVILTNWRSMKYHTHSKIIFSIRLEIITFLMWIL